jgi:hypothetical protein
MAHVARTIVGVQLPERPARDAGEPRRRKVGRDHTAWKRFALVTDVDWVAKAMHMFTWLTRGEVMIYDLDSLQEAKAWVAE